MVLKYPELTSNRCINMEFHLAMISQNYSFRFVHFENPDCRDYGVVDASGSDNSFRDTYLRTCGKCHTPGYLLSIGDTKRRVIQVQTQTRIFALMNAMKESLKIKELQTANDGNLREFADTRARFLNLEVLILQHNNICRLSDNIGLLTHLKSLDLSHNALYEIPPVIFTLCDLEHLYLNDNRIRVISSDILNLFRLRTLSIRHNPLISPPMLYCGETIDAIFYYLRNRKLGEELEVLRNAFVNGMLEMDAFESKNIDNTIRDDAICLSNGERNIMDGRFKIETVDDTNIYQTITDDDNCLMGEEKNNMDGTLTLEASKDTHFIKTIAVNCDTGDMPSFLKQKTQARGRLRKIVNRVLGKFQQNPNVIETVHFKPWVTQVTDKWLEVLTPTLNLVTEIHVQGALCAKLPNIIQDCANLVVLDIQDSNITNIPKIIVCLSKLEILNLSGNSLLEVSPYLGFLPKLKQVLLAFNPITSLPISLTNLTGLSRLDITGAKMVTPSMEICSLGIGAIFRELTRISRFRINTYGATSPKYTDRNDNSSQVEKLSSLCNTVVLNSRMYLQSLIPVLPPMLQKHVRDAAEERKLFCVMQCGKCHKSFSKERYFLLHECFIVYDIEYAETMASS